MCGVGMCECGGKHLSRMCLRRPPISFSSSIYVTYFIITSSPMCWCNSNIIVVAVVVAAECQARVAIVGMVVVVVIVFDI